MKVRLTIDKTETGYQATILERDDQRTEIAEISSTFMVDTIKQAKRLASSIARKHALDRYGVIDRSIRPALVPAPAQGSQLKPGLDKLRDRKKAADKKAVARQPASARRGDAVAMRKEIEA